MRILYLGGTGNISTACSELAVKLGYHVTVVNRGNHAPLAGVETLAVDLRDGAALRTALGQRTWNVVVNFIAFKPEDVERDIDVFRGRCGQYFFISSASCYQRPVRHYLVTESTPLVNPFWQYSRDKIACEERLMRALREEGFPVTVVRPSLTYGDSKITLPLNSWDRSYTVINRLRKGLPVIIPGDGTSLWTLTHNTDFAKGLVGLFGEPRAIGHAFHITSDEVMSWNQYFEAVAEAAGVAAPKFVHMTCDFLIACCPELQGTLLGDKATSVVMDNSKIRQFVPGFCATTRFSAGIRRTLAWFEADPARQTVDPAVNSRYDRLVGAYEAGMAAAVKKFTDGAVLNTV